MPKPDAIAEPAGHRGHGVVGYETRRRSLYKALSYRVLGLLTTTLVAWILMGNPRSALVMGVVDTLSKIGLFYGHERAWLRLRVGTRPDPDYEI